MDVSENSGTPQLIHFNRVFHYKPSIFGVPLIFGNPHMDRLEGRQFPKSMIFPAPQKRFGLKSFSGASSGRGESL